MVGMTVAVAVEEASKTQVDFYQMYKSNHSMTKKGYSYPIVKTPKNCILSLFGYNNLSHRNCIVKKKLKLCEICGKIIKKGGGCMKKSKVLLLLGVLMLLLLCACGTDEAENSIVPARLDILKIGKADCIVINTGTKIVMIDTGEKENLEDIRSFMNERDYKKVDTLILTHYDKDHIGCAKEIIEEYDVDTVLEPAFSSDGELFHEYHYALSQLGKGATRLKEDYTFKSDGCTFEINVPRQRNYKMKNDNNRSLVIKMICEESKFLFCGDAQEERLEEIIDTCSGGYDFVKLPYHGNYIENYSLFFEKIKMNACAVTCSKKNPADQRTLDMLTQNGIDTYETRYGTVSVLTDGHTVTVNQ